MAIHLNSIEYHSLKYASYQRCETTFSEKEQVIAQLVSNDKSIIISLCQGTTLFIMLFVKNNFGSLNTDNVCFNKPIISY